MYPEYPRLLPDRDKINDWYLDEDVHIVLTNGHYLLLKKGFKFDSHSVPWGLHFLFPRYYGNDIYAAMVHDCLVAGEHWLPYTRRFVDRQYKMIMNHPDYKTTKARAFWMPLAVMTWNALRYYWRDYRGKVPEKMHIELGVTVKVL